MVQEPRSCLSVPGRAGGSLKGSSTLKPEAPETQEGLKKKSPGNILTEPGETSYSSPGVGDAASPPPAETRQTRENALDAGMPEPLEDRHRAPSPGPPGQPLSQSSGAAQN